MLGPPYFEAELHKIDTAANLPSSRTAADSSGKGIIVFMSEFVPESDAWHSEAAEMIQVIYCLQSRFLDRASNFFGELNSKKILTNTP